MLSAAFLSVKTRKILALAALYLLFSGCSQPSSINTTSPVTTAQPTYTTTVPPTTAQTIPATTEATVPATTTEPTTPVTSEPTIPETSEPTVPATTIEPTVADTEPAQEYVLNKSTKKIHLPTCRSAGQIKEKNKALSTESKQILIDKGFSPCKICNP